MVNRNFTAQQIHGFSHLDGPFFKRENNKCIVLYNIVNKWLWMEERAFFFSFFKFWPHWLQNWPVGGNKQIRVIIHSASWVVCLNNQRGKALDSEGLLCIWLALKAISLFIRSLESGPQRLFALGSCSLHCDIIPVVIWHSAIMAGWPSWP